MIITYEHSNSSANPALADYDIAVQYTLHGSLTRMHFKTLMRLTTFNYQAQQRRGLISTQNVDAFLALVKQVKETDPQRGIEAHGQALQDTMDKLNCDKEAHEEIALSIDGRPPAY